MSLVASLVNRIIPRFWFVGLFAACLAGVGLWPGPGQAGGLYQGFGSQTPGGTGKPVVYVTNLNDSGTGSLREALKQGNRTVVFTVTGTLALLSPLKIKGAFLTLAGSSAPRPGITLTGAGLLISGTNNAHDIIVQGLRVRNPQGDGITIRDGAYNIVVDHVSIQGATDGSIDITQGAFDVTVQWSILAENVPDHNFLALVDSQALRVTFHHNLLVKGRDRHPQSGWDKTLATTPPDLVTDIRNNLIWDFSNDGTQIVDNTRSNVVNNFYYSSVPAAVGRELWVKFGGKVYARGNYSRNGTKVDSRGNQPQGFLAAPVDTTDACTAALQVRNTAGVRPLDATDQQYLNPIMLPTAPCPGT